MKPGLHTQVLRLLEAAMERSSQLWTDLVEVRCKGNEALRLEASRLLRGRGAAEKFLEQLELEAELEEETPEAPGANWPMNLPVGRYEVLDVLGTGGMGEVYRARDTALGREVALKFMPRRLSQDSAALARFRQEARAASALNHPNICVLHDIAEHNGTPFLVMELLDGCTLRALIARGPVRPDELAGIAVQAASALAEAHRHGIIHRDIKPANLFVTVDGVVKVLDFGLAKLAVHAQPDGPAFAAGGGGSGSAVTQSGVLLGTAAYVAPERLAGGAGDGRSDLFSLGVTLYEAATGRLPFPGRGARECCESILRDTPVRPCALNPAVPRGLDAIILRLLEKDPARRPQSAEDLLSELAQWRRRRSRTKWRRKALAGVASLAMVFLSGGYTLRARGTAELRLAVLPVRDVGLLKADPILLEGLLARINEDLSRLPGLRLISSSSVLHYVNSRKGAEAIGRELRADSILDGSAESDGQRVRIELRLTSVADGQRLWKDRFTMGNNDVPQLPESAVRAIGFALHRPGGTRAGAGAAIVGTRDRSAFENYIRGRHLLSLRTEDNVKLAISYFRAAIDADPAYAHAYAGLADCHNQAGTVAIGGPPIEHRPLAVASARTAVQLDPNNAEGHAALGFALLYNWEWEEAGRELDRALELNPSYGLAHIWKASWLMAHGRCPEAMFEAEKAAELDPLALIAQTQVGWFYELAGRTGAAISAYRRVLEVDPDFHWALWRLASVLIAVGRPLEAVSVMDRARASQADNPAIIGRLGMAYAAAGRRREALQALAMLDRLAAVRYVTPHARGEICLELGDADCYFSALQEGYRQRTNAMVYLRFDAAGPKRSWAWTDPRMQDLLRRMNYPAGAGCSPAKPPP